MVIDATDLHRHFDDKVAGVAGVSTFVLKLQLM